MNGIAQAALDSLPSHIAVLDSTGKIIGVNKAWVSFARTNTNNQSDTYQDYKNYNYLEVCDTAAGLNSEEAQTMGTGIREVIKGTTSEFKLQYPCHSPSEKRWFLARVTKAFTSDNTQAIVVAHENITERILAEMKYNELLDEKDAVLLELQHRIKNNISSIAGLLSVQMKSIKSPEAVLALRQAIARIRSVHILYQKLLISEGIDEIPVIDYVESLTKVIQDLFPSNVNVNLIKKIDDFKLDSKKLFALGLIINELISNSIKYAFDGKDSGQIKMYFHKVNEVIYLSLHDDGIGIPIETDSNQRKGFGLKLVELLTQELGATLLIENNNGTKVSISLPS